MNISKQSFSFLIKIYLFASSVSANEMPISPISDSRSSDIPANLIEAAKDRITHETLAQTSLTDEKEEIKSSFSKLDMPIGQFISGYKGFFECKDYQSPYNCEEDGPIKGKKNNKAQNLRTCHYVSPFDPVISVEDQSNLFKKMLLANQRQFADQNFRLELQNSTQQKILKELQDLKEGFSKMQTATEVVNEDLNSPGNTLEKSTEIFSSEEKDNFCKALEQLEKRVNEITLEIDAIKTVFKRDFMELKSASEEIQLKVNLFDANKESTGKLMTQVLENVEKLAKVIDQK